MIEIRKANLVPKLLLPPVRALPEIRYIPSLYALPFEHRGKRYVFHNITKQCIEGVLPGSARGGEGYDDLIEARFLVPEGEDECALCNRAAVLMHAGAPKGRRTYGILTTLGCNARCTYCYEEGQPQIAMTPETADRVIRYILETHTEPEVSLGWFGGEPLLGERIIDRICAGLREAGLAYTSRIISNGSLITPAMIRKMTEDWKLKEIQISMDGAEPDYLARKRYVAGEDCYRRVMESVDRLSEAGVTVKVSCNVDEENWDGVPRFLEDLSRAVTHRENVYVCFTPLFAVRRGEGDVAMWKKILEARSLIEKAGFRNLPVMRRGLNFPSRRCGVADGESDIWPDGSLYPCAVIAPADRYGDIWHGITDRAALEKYTGTAETAEKCRACPYLPNCTSFSLCPVKDRHCREVQALKMRTLLQELAEEWEKGHSEEEKN